MVSDLTTAKIGARAQWNNAFKIMRKMYSQISLLNPAKLSIKLSKKKKKKRDFQIFRVSKDLLPTYTYRRL